MRVWLLVTGLTVAGCDAVLCNPEYTCEGSVIVHCDVVCTGGGGKLDPPKECHKNVTRRDCRDEEPALGVSRTCKVIENVGVCLDSPVQPCTFSDPTRCSPSGARIACTQFYTEASSYRSTTACSPGTTCFPLNGTQTTCVDSPKSSCDPDGGYPRCVSETHQASCVGNPDSGYFHVTQSNGLCRDAG
ncbi:MAG: hypothetical protein JNG84_01280 [Archangium sp.]|nr:hypothetical protein [Archangium sp.]